MIHAPQLDTLLAISPDCRLSTVELFDGHRAVMVDDFLVDPARARAWAISQAAAFAERGGYYPGPELAVPPAWLLHFSQWWRRHLCAPLGLLRGGAASRARFSLITRRPHELPLKKRFCHMDPLFAGGGADTIGIAGVLYLFEDPHLGGTSFFRPQPGASFADMESLMRAGRMVELAARYPFVLEPPRYMLDSNPLFERMTAIPARFNRIVFYDSSLYHSPDVTDPERVTPDLDRGRLTVNFFINAHRAG